MSTEITKPQPTGIQKISNFINSENVKSKFAEILGKRATAFLSSVVTACNQNALLKEATTESIYTSALMAATLDLPINSNLGFAYIVPYKDNKTNIVSAQFQMGYKGFKQLAIRSGQFQMLHAKKVYQGQIIEDDSFLGYHFDWAAKSSDKVIGYANSFKLITGFESVFYLGIEEIEAHAKRYSQTYKKGFGLWKDDFDKMALKTVAKLHLNSGEAPLSVDMQRAVVADQAVLDENLNPTYKDNEVDFEEIKPDHELERATEILSLCKTKIELDEVFARDFESPDLREDIRTVYAELKAKL